MGCRSFGISQVLIGLYRVGIAGLKDALEQATDSGLADRGEIVDRLLETLAKDNFIPESQIEAYRVALWREYLRYHQRDFSEFYSEAEVTVRGEPDAELDNFLRMTHSVFGDFELKPVIRLEPPDPVGPNPQLIVREEAIVRGNISRAMFKTAVQQSLTDW